MVILDHYICQYCYIWIWKNPKFKNPKFVNCWFVIHKIWNKTSKSNSTSFMFNNIFCEMKGKKVTYWGRGWGNGGTVLISSWNCNFSIYSDIQAITTLYAFYWFFMCWFLLFINFSILQLVSWKVTFSGTQKPTPTVFNLQVSDWVHCEEGTGAYYQLSRFAYKLVKKNYEVLKFFILPKKYVFQKNP